MTKNNLIKTSTVTIISKTLSGSDCIVSFQEDQGKVHTIFFTKDESTKIDLGQKIKITLEKVEN